MSDNVQVIYNGNIISPPPFVSRTENPIDYGHRWGYEDSISLKGLYYTSGLTSGIITPFVALFSGNFAQFSVTDTGAGVTVLDYPYVILEDISFDSNHFYPNTYVPYTVKLKSINVPSGITEPTNEYSFTQNEDGTVSVNHHISAKGIVTSSNFDSALQNAKTFVRTFTGSVPFSPVFVSAGSGVLLSQAETLDRLTATYSIVEVFKYNSGEANPYFYTHSIDIDESPDADYVTMAFKYNRQGSSITSNLGTLRASLTTFPLYQFLNTQYGIATGDLYINTLNVVESSGKNEIQVTSSLVSGVGDEFLGMFDYNLSSKWDRIMDMSTFTIDGKFLSKAPISLKQTFLSNFKTNVAASGGFPTFLYDIVTGMASYIDPSGRALNPIPSSFSLTETTGLADLSCNATFSDKDFLGNISDTSFTVNFDAAHNIFEFKPSATVEGNFVIQDLQTLTREQIKLACSIKTTGNVAIGVASGITVETQIASGILDEYFLTESGTQTGIFDADVHSSYLNSTGVFGLDTRYYFSSNAPSIRPPSYLFGL